jgi:serine protease Do
VSKEGHVLTAGHVSGTAGREVTLLLPDGRKLKGKTLGIQLGLDSGLIQITDKGDWPVAVMGQSAELKPGQWCLALGHPGGYLPGRSAVARLGRILSQNPPAIMTDCALTGGDSGGPLLDLQGKVIGITSRGNAGAMEQIAVPVDAYRDTWERLVKGEVWGGFTRDPKRDALRKSSPEVLAAFRAAVTTPARSTVQVRCAGKDIALGTIVGPDGWVLTKASELKTRPVCKLPDGRELAAQVIGVQEAFDLALLKIEARGLIPVAWRPSTGAAVGHWVAAPGSGDAPVAVGVVSVATRTLPRVPAVHNVSSGSLGVATQLAKDGVKIFAVVPGSGAERAGLKPQDLILSVDGKAVRDPVELGDQVAGHKVGDVLALKVRRGDKEMEFKATLDRRRPVAPYEAPGLSKRRSGFPTFLEHDALLRAHECGGPLADLEGRVVGINIARASGVGSYAVPSEAIRPLLADLMSGKLAPKESLQQAEPRSPPQPGK